jgi:hypothetical protein
MTVATETAQLRDRLMRAGINLSVDEVDTLRRAERTLQRWGEGLCGAGGYAYSWSIERDENTGIPYRHNYYSTGNTTMWRIADRETGALKRVAAICAKAGIYYYHQTDPRGCSLYVSVEPLTDSDYTRGIACC